MKTIAADDVRIPRSAREAVAAHEEVVVLNRERPVFVIVNPDDHRRARGGRRGRLVSEAMEMLASAPLPDGDFGRELEEIIASAGSMPADPWAPS